MTVVRGPWPDRPQPVTAAEPLRRVRMTAPHIRRARSFISALMLLAAVALAAAAVWIGVWW